MKGLSLTQPFSTLIALGAKHIETRSYARAYRGPLAIHASATAITKADRELIERLPGFKNALWPHENYWPLHQKLPFGAIVATCDLVDVVPVETLSWEFLNRPRRWNGAPADQTFCELNFGNYAAGRYGWKLENIRKLPEPIPYKGALGLFNVPNEVFG